MKLMDELNELEELKTPASTDLNKLDSIFVITYV